jgi:four helix bundle protein
MQDFHQLDVWKRAHHLVLRIYTVSKELPSSENFGLILHLRRAAVSIARGIAEGTGRDTNAEFAVELKKARAAGHDLEYILLLSHDLGFISDDLHADLNTEVLEVRKMLSGLIKRVTSTAATLP